LHSNTPRMHSDKGIIEKMLRDNLIPAGQLCKMMQINSKGKFTTDNFDEQFRMRIEIDGKKLLGLDSTQDEFFSSVAETSQCEACGDLKTKSKMLTCSGCRVVHYCDKTCQREHWKNGHKALCTEKLYPKDVFRVAEFCSKMLTALAVGWDTEHRIVLNADSSHLCNAFLKYGCKDHTYLPVFEDDTLIYIPMPLKFVDYLVPESDKRVGPQKDVNVTGRRVEIAVQTKVPAGTNTHGGVFLLKRDTHVYLP